MSTKTLGRYATGMCSNGFHEGEKHRNFTGVPMAFCRGDWTTHLNGVHTRHSCKCICHERITELYASVGRERVWPETGVWWKADDPKAPQKVKFWLPSQDPSWALTKGSEASRITSAQLEERRIEKDELTPNERRVLKAMKFGMLPANPVFEIDGTQGGRHAGELELQVKKVCDEWTLGLMPDAFQLTCSTIAKAIDSERPPSTGAITNVLKRWDELGFAIHLTEPHRFDGYTEDGITLGVAELQRRRAANARSMRTVAAHAPKLRPRKK